MSSILEKSQPLYRQISSLIEKRILAGELNAGDRLAPTKKLAEEFGVTIQTAQQAAALLTKRGLVERTPGRGSFVSSRVHSRTIGIACGINIFGDATFQYYQRLYACLCWELKREGWNTLLYFPLDRNAPEQMLTELGRDVGDNRLRGVIRLCPSTALNEWLNDHSGLTLAEANPESVSKVASREDVAYRGIDYLLNRGYRRIAVILHTTSSRKKSIEQAQKHAAMAYDQRDLPMQATFYGGKANTHARGIEQARNALDKDAVPPEAFLVLNDLCCSGVIFELLCRKLSIPDDIAVMAMSNKGVLIPSPVPLTRIERDPMDEAHWQIEALKSVLEDREPAQVDFSSKLIVGKSCGE